MRMKLFLELEKSFRNSSNLPDIEKSGDVMITENILLRAKSNKKVLLTRSNKNDRNQQINNNNYLITLE